MPLVQDLAAKVKEVEAHEVLVKANVAARMKLEHDLAPITTQLAAKEKLLAASPAAIKTSTAAVAKLKAALTAAPAAGKAKITEDLKKETTKLKNLQEAEVGLKKAIPLLQAQVNANSAGFNKVAAEVKALAARKATLATELAALQVKKHAADAIDAYTWDTILGTPAILRDFGERNHVSEVVEFILHGPRGDKATYTTYVKDDNINLNGSGEIVNAFRALAKREAARETVDWTKAPWAAAHEYTIKELKKDGSQLATYKTRLKAARGLS
jgi:hypothetical protein